MGYFQHLYNVGGLRDIAQLGLTDLQLVTQGSGAEMGQTFTWNVTGSGAALVHNTVLGTASGLSAPVTIETFSTQNSPDLVWIYCSTGQGANGYSGGTNGSLQLQHRVGAQTGVITDMAGVSGFDWIEMSDLEKFTGTPNLRLQDRNDGVRINSYEEEFHVVQGTGRVLQAFDLSLSDFIFSAKVSAEGALPGSDVIGTAANERLLGTGGRDFISGEAGNDTLDGGGGHDTLNGGAGADALSGGDGLDAVDYTGSRGSLRVDLLYPQVNTNVAAGDTYFSIENLIGSQGFDNLRGTLEANWIFGASNVDYIFGRRGNDTLDGGIGDDVLFGGVGADVLIGGIHRDRAQYSESLTALVLDLAVPGRNTGEAAGDTYDSIEDLAGGKFDDLIWGDDSANRLFGREGADVLDGRMGDDYLNGGAQADTLIGGAGDDTLRGGTHGDTFVFNVGDDVIEDFRGDLGDVIRLQASGLPFGTTTRPDYIVSQFGSLRGGDVVLDFGGAGSLTLDNVTQLNQLSEYIIIF